MIGVSPALFSLYFPISAIYQFRLKELKLHMAEFAWLIGGRARTEMKTA